MPRTELEWSYKPENYFEAPYHQATADFEVVIDGGRALATLSSPADPVPQHLEDQVKALVENIFLVRQLQLHKTHDLEGPTIHQYRRGQKHTTVRARGVCIAISATRADVVITNAAGNIVLDSKADRLAGDVADLDDLAPKVTSSQTLQDMLESYSQAIKDSGDELIHLYEIRDALTQHYGNETLARKNLKISKSEWNRLGALANAEPLEQSRHRGKHPAENRRPATIAELEEARSLARQWIHKFSDTL
jgi:hypothetical protein